MDPHVRDDQWATGPTWGDPPTYEAVYSEVSLVAPSMPIWLISL